MILSIPNRKYRAYPYFGDSKCLKGYSTWTNIRLSVAENLTDQSREALIWEEGCELFYEPAYHQLCGGAAVLPDRRTT
jgi:hypothetical protein